MGWHFSGGHTHSAHCSAAAKSRKISLLDVPVRTVSKVAANEARLFIHWFFMQLLVPLERCFWNTWCLWNLLKCSWNLLKPLWLLKRFWKSCLCATGCFLPCVVHTRHWAFHELLKCALETLDTSWNLLKCSWNPWNLRLLKSWHRWKLGLGVPLRASTEHRIVTPSGPRKPKTPKKFFLLTRSSTVSNK